MFNDSIFSCSYTPSASFAKEKVPSLACLEKVKKATLEKLKEDKLFGNPCNCYFTDGKPQFIEVNAGGIYILPFFVQRTFDWKAIVVLNKECEIKSIEVPSL